MNFSFILLLGNSINNYCDNKLGLGNLHFWHLDVMQSVTPLRKGVCLFVSGDVM